VWAEVLKLANNVPESSSVTVVAVALVELLTTALTNGTIPNKTVGELLIDFSPFFYLPLK